MDRRQFVAAASGLFAALAGCGETPEESPTMTTVVTSSPSKTSSTTDAATDSPSDTETMNETETDTENPSIPDSVGLEPIATGLENPLDMAFVPDSELRYVAEQSGTVRVVADGSVRSTPLLDRRDAISRGYEKGLLGIALHPEFAENRRLFVRYSAPARANTPDGYSHTFVLSEFRVGTDGYQVEAGSEQELLTIPQPQGNHNAGSLLFGPDGYLYIGVGDGGAGNDQGDGHVDDWYDAVDGGNGQDVSENLLGSILRIDVDQASEQRPYSIPDSNPLVGEGGLDEQYAWGFRNPWRLSFDGDQLFAGDVGQNAYEEVNLVERGGNYGWNVTEGAHCFQASRCPDETPADVRGGEPLIDPIIEYPHGNEPVSGVSVIIGNVYRGSVIPGLQGQFVFGDFSADGRLFVAAPEDAGMWDPSPLPIDEADAGKVAQILSFARHNGEIYVLGLGSEDGAVYRLQS